MLIIIMRYCFAILLIEFIIHHELKFMPVASVAQLVERLAVNQMVSQVQVLPEA